jgi:predicted DNA-binding protein (MmcQ/YjbR family)
MTPQELRAFCLSFNAAVEDFPFSPEISVFKVQGRLFALSHLDARPPEGQPQVRPGRRAPAAPRA